jgi:uncharacterized protein (TIGR03437 family)
VLILALVVLVGSSTIGPSGKYVLAASLAGEFAFQYDSCTLTCTASAPSTGTASTPVSFTASATATYCTGAPTYSWNFGDGSTTSSQQSPTHAYTAAGTYTWTLTVSISEASCTQSGTITINARTNPVASVSAASYSGSGLASEVIAAAFGAKLATATQSADTIPLPTSLAGTRVLVKDSANAEQLAPLFFVSPGQINYQIPPGIAVGAATLTVTSGDGSVSTGTMQIAAVAPGLFAANADGQGVAAALALRVKADGSQSIEPIAQWDGAQNKMVARPLDLGQATDQVFLILFGTGIRYHSSLAAASVKLGGEDAQVLYAGPQGNFVGLDQVNVRVPRSLIGRGEVDIVLTVDGKTANTVKANIR